MTRGGPNGSDRRKEPLRLWERDCAALTTLLGICFSPGELRARFLEHSCSPCSEQRNDEVWVYRASHKSAHSENAFTGPWRPSSSGATPMPCGGSAAPPPTRSSERFVPTRGPMRAGLDVASVRGVPLRKRPEPGVAPAKPLDRLAPLLRPSRPEPPPARGRLGPRGARRLLGRRVPDLLIPAETRRARDDGALPVVEESPVRRPHGPLRGDRAGLGTDAHGAPSRRDDLRLSDPRSSRGGRLPGEVRRGVRRLRPKDPLPVPGGPVPPPPRQMDRAPAAGRAAPGPRRPPCDRGRRPRVVSGSSDAATRLHPLPPPRPDGDPAHRRTRDRPLCPPGLRPHAAGPCCARRADRHPVEEGSGIARRRT